MDKIYISRDGKKIELKGEELETFLAQRAKDDLEYAERQSLLEAEQLAKEAARKSAMDKLAKLGLTEEEIAALVP